MGIVAYVDGSQGVCQQEGCKGAERVRTEITAMGNLLGAIDNLYQVFLVAPKNRELIARHAKNLFSVYEKYKETVEASSSGSPVAKA